MKLAVLVSVLGVLGGAASGCGDNLDGNARPPASCVPGCAGARTYDAVAYALHASFDWDAQQLTASEDLTLDTTASGPIVELDAAVAVTNVHAGPQDLAYAVDATAHTLVVDLTPLAGAAASTFTVDYTAAPATSLIATTSTADDPVRSRVVYTDSEPDRALYWLVTNLDPADRALWSVAITVDAGEDVIANGTRTSDTQVEGRRVVAYALDKPIPAYLMAFAAGQLDHTDRGGPVPLSVWYRHGLVLDPDVTLDEVADAMATFDAAIMPYPWDTYSVVLLPYGGGMENATITFNNETSGQGPGDFVLNAHELAHHWFGDWVTMHGFDDVWFKEGMATVLESEAERARRDRQGTGRLWGTDYGYRPTDAVVDDSLHGLDKYTSGPYERAGWMITQIRATVGEDAFWAGLRALLATHAVGSATGEQFIRSFQPALDEAAVQRLLAALPQKTPPTLAVTTAAAGADVQVTLTLADPSALMLAPLDFAVVDAAGAAVTSQLTASAPLVVMVPAGGYLGADERDVHPPWYYDFGVVTNYRAVGALFAPPATAAAAVLAAFESRSAAQQEKASELDLLPLATPDQLAGYLAALDSDVARNRAVIAACATASQTSNPAWLTAAKPALEAPARLEFDERFTACDPAYAMQTLEPELVAALADGSPPALARLEYLMSFDYGADTATVIGNVATTAPTLRLREIARQRLADTAPHAAHRPPPRSHLRAARP